MIELYVTVFRPAAWTCFWDMLDLDLNEGGWGYDKCFSELCRVNMAIFTRWNATHSQQGGRTAGKVDAHGRDEQGQMDVWIERMKSVGEEDPHHFFVRYCAGVRLW